MHETLSETDIKYVRIFKTTDVIIQTVIYLTLIIAPLIATYEDEYNDFGIFQGLFFFIMGLYQLLTSLAHRLKQKKYNSIFIGRHLHLLFTVIFFTSITITIAIINSFQPIALWIVILHIIALYYFIISIVETVRLIKLAGQHKRYAE